MLVDVSMSVGLGERAGIVGENGSGKSTLLRLLAGVEPPDDGDVTTADDTGYLSQTLDLPPSHTVQQAVDAALADLRAMERRMRDLESALANQATPRRTEATAETDEARTKRGDAVTAQHGEPTAECGEVPARCGEVPARCGEVPARCGDAGTAQHGEATAVSDEVPTEHHDAVTAQHSETTAECSEVPAKCGDAGTAEHGEATAQRSDVATKRGETTERRGEATAQRGEATEQRGEVATKHDEATDNRGEVAIEYADLMDEYGELLTAYELRGGYEADARVDKAFHGLGLSHVGRDRVLSSLSGGEQARLGLACVLAAAPRVLLLDEPTNHLDESALTWLESRLREHRGTVVVVSHDRVFLDRVATTVIEVEHGAITRFGGGYTGFLAAKAAARARWEQSYAAWCEEVRQVREYAATTAHRVAAGRLMRDNNKMAYDRNAGRVQSSVASRVRNAQERLRRLEADPVPRPPAPLRFRGTFTSPGPETTPKTGPHQRPRPEEDVALQAGHRFPDPERESADPEQRSLDPGHRFIHPKPKILGPRHKPFHPSRDHGDPSDGHRDPSGGHRDPSDGHRDSSGGHGDPSDGHQSPSGGHQDPSGSHPELIDVHPDPSDVNHDTEHGDARAQVLVALRDVRVGDRLHVPSLTIRSGDRLLVRGANGAGKSTLLRTIAEHGRARVGYLPQEVTFDPDLTVLDAYGSGYADERRAALLDTGLFAPGALDQKVGTLSVGQRRRLALAGLLTREYDLLLLDEPTNHLSPVLAEELEQALDAYRGGLVVVSHDRALTRRFRGTEITLVGGRIH
ncbi:ATP-binding cassette domain-containing protein [Nonomuraea phyllanthi]|uniref:ATP-binding cassette domain-containing protein n=1 Tax=Nonomuraea phyllanthi TaxID=2219224 RepID=UPI001D02FD01|nr:ATP-binding cassette domain-containing protein [Nonomuraea phyllanthi]